MDPEESNHDSPEVALVNTPSDITSSQSAMHNQSQGEKSIPVEETTSDDIKNTNSSTTAANNNSSDTTNPTTIGSKPPSSSSDIPLELMNNDNTSLPITDVLMQRKRSMSIIESTTSNIPEVCIPFFCFFCSFSLEFPVFIDLLIL